MEKRDPMFARASTALDRTWSAIGYDVIQAVADESGKNPERITIPRDEVIDAVTACGYKDGYPSSYGNDDEAVEWLDAQDDDTKKKVLKDAFSFRRYGL